MLSVKYLFVMLLFALSTLGFISCCQKKASSTETEKKNVQVDYSKEGYVHAKVFHYDLDGCNLMLKLDNDKKLEVVGMPEDLKYEGIEVWIKFVPAKDVMSTCMAGQLVRITDYKIIK